MPRLRSRRAKKPGTVQRPTEKVEEKVTYPSKLMIALNQAATTMIVQTKDSKYTIIDNIPCIHMYIYYL